MMVSDSHRGWYDALGFPSPTSPLDGSPVAHQQREVSHSPLLIGGETLNEPASPAVINVDDEEMLASPGADAQLTSSSAQASVSGSDTSVALPMRDARPEYATELVIKIREDPRIKAFRIEGSTSESFEVSFLVPFKRLWMQVKEDLEGQLDGARSPASNELIKTGMVARTELLHERIRYYEELSHAEARRALEAYDAQLLGEQDSSAQE